MLQSIPLGHQYFAEGLALKNNRLVQLTWLENTANTFYCTGKLWKHMFEIRID